MCEHANMPEYMEHFKTYTENQGATNAGKNFTYAGRCHDQCGLTQAHPNNTYTYAYMYYYN